MVRFAIVMLAALVALPLAAQAKANADETAHRKIEASLEKDAKVLAVLRAYNAAEANEPVFFEQQPVYPVYGHQHGYYNNNNPPAVIYVH